MLDLLLRAVRRPVEDRKQHVLHGTWLAQDGQLHLIPVADQWGWHRGLGCCSSRLLGGGGVGVCLRPTAADRGGGG